MSSNPGAAKKFKVYMVSNHGLRSVATVTAYSSAEARRQAVQQRLISHPGHKFEVTDTRGL